MLKKITYLIFLLFFSQTMYAQNTYEYGTFNIRNFGTNEYKGVSQNWDIIQNNSDYILVANNAGVLLFDGTEWVKVHTENEEAARSFAKNKNGNIFVGGDNEFGKVYFDENGEFKYQKLSQKYDSLKFGKVWNTISVFDDIYFISPTSIFKLDDQGSITQFSVPNKQTIRLAYLVDNTICCVIYENNEGQEIKHCVTFDGTGFREIRNSREFIPYSFFETNNISYVIGKDGEIREVVQIDNSYKFESIGNKLPLPSGVYINSVVYNKKIFAAGTNNGIFIFNKKGEFIRTIQEKEGLVNLKIGKLYFDHDNNLWSCNDNGISLIDISNPITTFDKKNGITFATEGIYFSEETDLLATRSDLFRTEIIDGKRHFINTEVFNMATYQIKTFTFPDGVTKTLVIGNNGIYEYINNTRIEIGTLWAWDLFQSTSNPNRIWVGLDGDGIGSLIYKNGEIKIESRKIKNTSGEVRKVIELDNKVYYTVKKEGVFILDSTKSQEKNVLPGLIDFQEKNKSIEYLQFTMGQFKDKIYVGTDNGLYTIENNKLVSFSDDFTAPRLKIHRIYNQKDSKLWIVQIKNNDTPEETYEIGYIDFFNEQDFNYTSAPFKTVSKEVIQTINVDTKDRVWFGGITEIYVYNPETTNDYLDNINVYITKISTLNDSTITHHTQYSTVILPKINYNLNTITINFSSASYVGTIKNSYSYYLEGLDTEWVEWNTKTEAIFPRLSEGTYTFHVKAKNYYGIESPETTYTFTILPPWYRTWWAYLTYFIITIVVIYIIIKLSIRRVKEQNEKLEKIVEERTAKVELQKEEIEEKNRDIVDSIKYAKRIQNTILPTNDRLDNILESYFVIYKPKDIVSGDFYWADFLDGKSYFSAIDCTGHGVPGAFVSIVGFNGLKRTVNEFKHRKPGLILDKLTDIVVETFTATESHLKDGMDMSLCCIDYKTLKLEFAGANNPLILIRNGELIETKGNKQPIGDFEHRVPFTNHEIQLQKGDVIYLFTDGYADQFGGPKGKKFKLKTLKNLLLEVSLLQINEQKAQLETAFNEWKGKIEQLDDVCLIGVKI